MKIKRYTAPSMRAALALVRSEQGPDAVILSSRRGEEGLEVIAAVDYDEALFADAKRHRTAAIMVPPDMTLPAAPIVPISPIAPIAPIAPTVTAAPKMAAAPKIAVAPPKTPPAPIAGAAPKAPMASTAARASPIAARPMPRPVAASAGEGLGAMQRELQDLRRLLETR